MIPFRRIAVLIAALAGAALSSCGQDKKLSSEPVAATERLPEQSAVRKISPEVQAFFDLVGKIRVTTRERVGMTEAEVDAIFQGYAQCRTDHPDPIELDAIFRENYQKIPRPPIDRQSCYIKTYDSKPDANDGDYCLEIVFDDKHAVVGINSGFYVK